MSDVQLFKHYFGLELASEMAEKLQQVYPDFPTEHFIAQIRQQVDALELKDRVMLFARALHDALPKDYLAALAIVLKVLGAENPAEDGMFKGGWYVMPLAQFVETYGLGHVDESLLALREITKRNTAEFAIRPYLTQYPEKTLETLMVWTDDESPHIRRLVSEGTRTRLPWASRLKQFVDNPQPVIALLERLKNDPSRYVQRSVANNLNDIGKDHPDLMLEIVSTWHQNASPATEWIIRHALRNHIKQGHPVALRLLEYSEAVQVSLAHLTLSPTQLKVGDKLNLSFTLKNETDEAQALVVDYLVYFVRANGKRSPKVFKLKNVTLEAHQTLEIRKNHSFQPITTRRYYAGLQRIEIQVNGQVLGGADFMLMAE